MKLSNKHKRYVSSAPQPAGRGGEGLLRLLTRDADSNAPYFTSGNLLFHSMCTKDKFHNNSDFDSFSFRACEPTTPGLHHTAIFPTTCSVETTDRLTDEAADLAFYRHGQKIELAWQREGRKWTPWEVCDSFRGGDLALKQRIGIVNGEYADVLGCRIEIEGDISDLEVELVGRVFRESELYTNGSFIQGRISAESEAFFFMSRPDYPGPWAGQKPPSKAVGTCYGLYTNIEVATPDARQLLGREGDTYRLRGRPGRTLWILFAAGFERDEVDRALTGAIANLDGFFDRACLRWHDFFRREVPAFTCSDEGIERFYAESMETTLISTYDVPYDPFRYTISVPAGKCAAAWRQQFPHDSTFASRALLWLNDGERCKHDLLQMMDVQFIHMAESLGSPDPDPVRFFHVEFMGRAMIAWEVFCRTGDKEFLRTLLPRFMECDRRRCRPHPSGVPIPPDVEDPPCSWQLPNHVYDPDGDWLINSVLSGDDTCRADAFIKVDRPKHWYENPDVVLESADTNLWLLGERVAMRRMAEVLDERDVVKELDQVIAQHRGAIEKLMWQEKEGRYADIVETSHEVGPVREAANVTAALFGGFIDQDRAERVMKDLLDPEVFWTPLPCPSCPVNHAGVNGKPGFRPTGYWRGRTWPLFIYEAIFGLYRHGKKAHAAYVVHRILDSLVASPFPSPENYNALNRVAVGAPMMSWSSQLMHPILSMITGLIMRSGDDLEFDPIALDPNWQTFHFGPFLYRPNVEVTVEWNKGRGYAVTVNGRQWAFPVPTRFVLAADGGDYRLVEGSVTPVRFEGRPPVAIELAKGRQSGAELRLRNSGGARVTGTVVFRVLKYDQGLTILDKRPFVVEPDAVSAVAVALPDAVESGKTWLLASLEIDGYPVTVAEGLEL